MSSIWRALTAPLQDSPLALCDSRTIAPEDLVATDIVFPHYLDEAYEVRYNRNHRWFYKQGMSEEDVILFKLDDTAANVARCKVISAQSVRLTADLGRSMRTFSFHGPDST